MICLKLCLKYPYINLKGINSTQCSQAVSHPSTDEAQCCLTSVIGREPVHSAWYGRWQESEPIFKDFYHINLLLSHLTQTWDRQHQVALGRDIGQRQSFGDVLFRLKDINTLILRKWKSWFLLSNVFFGFRNGIDYCLTLYKLGTSSGIVGCILTYNPLKTMIRHTYLA